MKRHRGRRGGSTGGGDPKSPAASSEGRGRLLVIGTPLGNLGDITARAVEALRGCDLVACEDTRRTRALLTHFGVSVRAVSYHKFNEASRLSRIVEELKSGRTVALVSDAGTPGISDPGARLVAAARDAGIDVEAFPGPSAPAAALSVAGIEAAGYVFAGYPPPKSAARRRFFRSLAAAEEARAAADPSATPWPLVLFEAPHRIEACLSDLEAELGDRSIVAIREMTKIHEETLRGTVSSVAAALRERQRRGEFTLVVTGALGFLKRSVERSMPENRSELRAAYDEIVRAGTDRREALRRLARERGLTRNELYRELAAAGGDPSPDDDGAEDATGG